MNNMIPIKRAIRPTRHQKRFKKSTSFGCSELVGVDGYGYSYKKEEQ